MTLPYPLEAETGGLGGPPPARQPPLPLKQLVRRAIFCQDGRLFAFGHELGADAGATVEEACKGLCETVVRAMQERQPFAVEEHWRRLDDMMKAQLDDGDGPAHAARTAVLTIHGM